MAAGSHHYIAVASSRRSVANKKSKARIGPNSIGSDPERIKDGSRGSRSAPTETDLKTFDAVGVAER